MNILNLKSYIFPGAG